MTSSITFSLACCLILVGLILGLFLCLVVSLLEARRQRRLRRTVEQQMTWKHSALQHTVYLVDIRRTLTCLIHLQAVMSSGDVPNPTLADLSYMVHKMAVQFGRAALLEEVIQTFVEMDVERQLQQRLRERRTPTSLPIPSDRQQLLYHRVAEVEA